MNKKFVNLKKKIMNLKNVHAFRVLGWGTDGLAIAACRRGGMAGCWAKAERPEAGPPEVVRAPESWACVIAAGQASGDASSVRSA